MKKPLLVFGLGILMLSSCSIKIDKKSYLFETEETEGIGLYQGTNIFLDKEKKKVALSIDSISFLSEYRDVTYYDYSNDSTYYSSRTVKDSIGVSHTYEDIKYLFLIELSEEEENIVYTYFKEIHKGIVADFEATGAGMNTFIHALDQEVNGVAVGVSRTLYDGKESSLTNPSYSFYTRLDFESRSFYDGNKSYKLEED